MTQEISRITPQELRQITLWAVCLHEPEENQFTVLCIFPLEQAVSALLDFINENPRNSGAYLLKPVELSREIKA